MATTLSLLHPLADAVGVERSLRVHVRAEDDTGPLDVTTLQIVTRQTPHGPGLWDGWHVLVRDGLPDDIANPAHSEVVETAFGAGTRIDARVAFIVPLMPGATYDVWAVIEDPSGTSYTIGQWSFVASDVAKTVEVMDDLSRMVDTATRRGWAAPLTMSSTYSYDADPAVTGAAVASRVNTSLVADLVDQWAARGESVDPSGWIVGVRRYRLLARRGVGFPRDALGDGDVLDDSLVTATNPVFPDRGVPGEQEFVSYEVDQLAEGDVVYETLFILRPPWTEGMDWSWVFARRTTSTKAISYGRWGHGAWLFKSMPLVLQVEDGADLPDGDRGVLERLLGVFGAVFDSLKTEADARLLAWDVPNVDADALQHIDSTLGWITNFELEDSARRRETGSAVALYKVKGRATGLESFVENLSGWDATVHEGWKRVMFASVPECVTPSTSVDVGAIDGPNDPLFYTPTIQNWHGIGGWGLHLRPVDGLTQELAGVTLEKIARLAPELLLPSWVVLSIMVEMPTVPEDVNVSVDEVLASTVAVIVAEDIPVPGEWHQGWWGTGTLLMVANTVGRVTCDANVRVHHRDLGYRGTPPPAAFP